MMTKITFLKEATVIESREWSFFDKMLIGLFKAFLEFIFSQKRKQSTSLKPRILEPSRAFVVAKKALVIHEQTE